MINYMLCLLPYVAVLVGLHLLSSAWAALLIYHLGIVAVIVHQGRILRWRRLFLGFGPRQLAAAMAVCLLSGPVVFGLWKLMALEAAVDPGAVLALYGLSGTSWGCFVVYFVVVNPALEEQFWRDYLRSPLIGPSVVDVAFAGYHVLVLCLFITWPWALVGCCVLAIAGWFWRRMSMEQDGLLGPWLSHTAADASILIAVCVLDT